MFSKHVLWKEEGLDEFIQQMGKMFSKNDVNVINNIINLIMKMVFLFLSEKHPVVNIRAIEIFQNLLKTIMDSKTKLEYDFTITDNILIKIKEKVGDVNNKVRAKSVDLYTFMLKTPICDYNNLLSELVEDELRLWDAKKIQKSSKLILGKLSIFENVINDYNNALKDKRTESNTFPFNLLNQYIFENINHSKAEIRKLTRLIIIKEYKLWGFKKLEPFLKKLKSKS